MQLHQGAICAHSEGVGRGTRIEIRLPISQSGFEAAPESASLPKQVRTAASSRPLRVLVADDNVDSAQTMGLLLESLGHVVRCVHDGLAAVQTAVEFRPELILLDIGMPKLNGLEACGQIRSQMPGNLVIVAMTGWGQPLDRERSAAAGFSHHLVKPVEIAELIKIIAGVVVRAPAL